MAKETNLLLSCEYVNLDQNSWAGTGDDVFVSCYSTPNEVYKGCMREYGRCIGKVYVDGSDNKSIHIGWIFLKRVRYESSKQTYLQETWVKNSYRPTSPKYSI